MRRGCLREAEIRHVLNGALHGEPLELVAWHIETCSRCLARMEAVAGGIDNHGEPQGPPSAPPAPGGRFDRSFHAIRLPDRAPHLPDGRFPERLGAYEILEELGRGGMGIVFKARQLSLNRLVALKVHPCGARSSPPDLCRLQLEARAVARLKHPHIVPVYEVGKQGTLAFLSMQFVQGTTLSNVSADCPGRDPAWLRRSARWLSAVARAVHYAHQQGILHRDLKPGNILVDTNGKPYLTDFGLATRAGAGSTSPDSRASLGTPQYAAPEQLAGCTEAVTTASDVYSLGAILYDLLTGHPPFVGSTTLGTIRRVLDEKPGCPRVDNPAVDPDLAAVCLKCLGKNPGERYVSAAALADDLERWLRREPVSARSAVGLDATFAAVWKQPVMTVFAGLLWLALLAISVCAILDRVPMGSGEHARPSWCDFLRECP